MALWALAITISFLFILFTINYVVTFPDRHPDKTLKIGELVTNFFQQVTLPIKLLNLSNQPADEKLLMPVYGARVSGVSDTWMAARDGGERSHEGQDIFAPRGTPIFSATKGYVTRIGEGELGGLFVFVTGAGGRRYYYAHLDSYASGLDVGDEVTTDTVLGFVGNTGNARTTPPHLHFGMYERREAVNPISLFVDR